jgi:glycine cleavage system H lipoate-binding protein
MNSKVSLNLIPFGDVKCIWMSTGLVDYKLCEKNSDCDNCEFYKIMREEAFNMSRKSIYADASKDEVMNFDSYKKKIHSMVHNYRFYKRNLYYSKDLWIKTEERTAIIGLNSFIRNLLPQNISFIFPVIGSKIKQGHPIFWLSIGNNIISIKAPVSGIVKKVNNNSINFLNNISDSEYDEGWLVSISLSNFEKEKYKLCNFDQITINTAKEADRIEKNFLSAVQDNYSNIGPTMHDGGAETNDIYGMLGESRYLELINSLFY